MRHRFSDLVDLASFQSLLESLHQATGILPGLVDGDDQVLTTFGWQQVCTRFHRTHPCTNERCQANTRRLAASASSAPHVGRACGNGLMDYAAAIVVEGERLATLYFQVLHEPPDLEAFRVQARECGFDESEYLAAIREVPVLPPERVASIMAFYAELARVLAQSGLDRLRQREAEQRLANDNRELASRIEERTRELAAKNDELQREVDERKQVEQALRASKKRLQAVMDSSPVAMGWSSQDGRIEYVNRRFTELFGYERDDIPAVFERWLADDTAGDRDEVSGLAAATALREDGSATFTDTTIVCKDGSIRHVVLGVAWAGDRRLGTFLDVTDRWLADQRELARQGSLALIARDAPLPRTLGTIIRGVQVEDGELVCSILMRDAEGAQLRIDASGSGPADMSDHHPECMFHTAAPTRAPTSCWSEDIRLSTGQVLATFLVCHRHQREVTDGERRSVARACQLASIAIERQRARAELEHQARTDFLTGLPNRRRLFEVAEAELKRALRYRRPFSVLMVDVDRFKDVNDEHGHDGGDLVLQTVAEVLRETARSVDTVARLGGEEFAVVLPEASELGAIESAERLRVAIEHARTETTGGDAVQVTVSIGVASLDDEVADLESLFARADRALYLAKKGGRNRVCSAGGLESAWADTQAQ